MLGKALMWMITSLFADDHIPVDVKEEVLSDWAHVCGGDSDLDVEQSGMYKNPIQKLAVVVSGDFGAVFLTHLGSWSRVTKLLREVNEHLECRDRMRTFGIS